MDTGDPSLQAYGVVDDGRRRATFFATTLSRSVVSPRPRLTLRGLDPETAYPIRPVVGEPPSGLVPPLWWGAPQDVAGTVHYTGVVLPGSILMAQECNPRCSTRSRS